MNEELTKLLNKLSNLDKEYEIKYNEYINKFKVLEDIFQNYRNKREKIPEEKYNEYDLLYKKSKIENNRYKNDVMELEIELDKFRKSFTVKEKNFKLYDLIKNSTDGILYKNNCKNFIPDEYFYFRYYNLIRETCAEFDIENDTIEVTKEFIKKENNLDRLTDDLRDFMQGDYYIYKFKVRDKILFQILYEEITTYFTSVRKIKYIPN